LYGIYAVIVDKNKRLDKCFWVFMGRVLVA